MSSSGFDRLAPAYDTLASLVFGNAIKEVQSWLVRHIPHGSIILITGGGTGWILEEIERSGIPCSIHYLDISGGMIRRASTRKGIGKDIVFQQGEVKDLQDSLLFDIIICPFFLDLFEEKELSQIIHSLDFHLKPGGKLLYADFQKSTGVKSSWSAFLISAMYSFFRIAANISAKKLEDPWPYLKRLGYISAARRNKKDSMLRGEVFLKKLPE